jgi:hypothetical protein
MSAVAGIGLAMQMGGVIVQAFAAQKAAENMKRELEQQRALQNQFIARSMKTWGGLLSGYEGANVEQTLQQSEMSRAAAMNKMQGVNFTPSGVLSSPRDVAASGLMGGRQAAVGAYSDWALERAMKELRSREKLAHITSSANSYASVFPSEMYAAQHSRDKEAKWGKILQESGQMVTMAGGGWGGLAKSVGGVGAAGSMMGGAGAGAGAGTNTAASTGSQWGNNMGAFMNIANMFKRPQQ